MHKSDCLYCRIVAGEEQAWKVYEDKDHIAFLTPFPNTPGFTVLITREHFGSYLFDLEKNRYVSMLKAARKLAKILDKKLGTTRTGLIIEGMGVDHAHIKLVPMHGIPEGDWKPIRSASPDFQDQYRGFLESKDGPRMADEELDRVQKSIVG